MGTTTAFIIFILIGFSYQQDAVDISVGGCASEINTINQQCVDRFPINPSASSFCDAAFSLSQCLDSSCLEPNYRDTIRSFVPPLMRPGSCPICSTIPSVVSTSRKSCSVWGLYHVIDFNSDVVLCPRANSTILLNNTYFTITALTNTTVDDRVTSGILYPAITGIRLDYHGCAVYSRTWLSKDDWDTRRIPAQGWFPHLITITQNTTEAVVNLLGVNTDFIIRKSGRYMSISIRTGLSEVSDGVCAVNGQCTEEGSVVGYPIAATSAPCTALPTEFQLGCQFDLANSNQTANLGLSGLDASISFARVNVLGDGANLGTIDARNVAMPVVLTVVSTGIFLVIFFIALFTRRSANEANGKAALNGSVWRPVTLAVWFIWLFFGLNLHVLGFVYPFTGLMFVSMAFNIFVLALHWFTTLRVANYGRGVFVALSNAFRAFFIMIVVQQLIIAIIGAAANEWYLWEVQFWWGIAVLVFLLLGGLFYTITALDVFWMLASDEPKPPKPVREDPVLRAEMELAPVQPVAPVEPARPARYSMSSASSSSSSSRQTKPVVETPVVMAHVVDVNPPSHVVQPSHVVDVGVNVNPPSHVFVPPPQEHVIQPTPMVYGNPTDAPPPPKEGGAFASPSPLDVYQNPAKYMSEAESSSDPARHMLKRAIKLAAIDVNSTKENQIYAKLMELLQTYNLTGVVSRDDGEAATLRNNLASDISEELKLYQNESLDELSYGLKEAILLWKEDNHL